MIILKILKQIHKLPLSITIAGCMYCIKKLTPLKSTKKEANLKKLILCLDKGNGKVSKIGSNSYFGYLTLYDKKFNFELRNEQYSDVGILYEFMFENEFDDLFSYLSRNFTSDSILNVVDLGGNIGLFCLSILLKYPKANTIYVEPDIDAVKQYKSLLAFNNLHNSNIFNLAAANQSDNYVELNQGPRGPENAGFITKLSENSTNIKTISVSNIIQKTNINLIDVLKIDIEGAEEDVILGNTFDEILAKKIKCIAIEIHDDQVDRFKIESKLESLNFIKIFNNRVDVFVNNLL